MAGRFAKVCSYLRYDTFVWNMARWPVDFKLQARRNCFFPTQISANDVS